MNPVTAMAPLQGYAPISFNAPPSWRELLMHRFEEGKDGQLLHYTEDGLRATVPPEGWDSYCEQWPQARAVVEKLKVNAASTAKNRVVSLEQQAKDILVALEAAKKAADQLAPVAV